MKHIWVFAALLPLVVTGCTAEWIIPEDYYVECESDADCPDTASCMLTDDGTARVCVTAGRAECGNGVQEAGETCDDGNEENGDYCSSDCEEVTSVCGDGKQELAEVCDHNGEIDGWYCNEGCLVVRKECGDSVVALSIAGRDGEVCDEGSENTSDYQLTQTCNATCSGYGFYCGDGIQTDAEVCDDANLSDNSYNADLTERQQCNTTCDGYRSHCGDGTQDAGENCDDGNDESGDMCSRDCLARCGDGFLNPSNNELCDDGDANTDAWTTTQRCNTTCNGYSAYCGDGNIDEDANEECDDGQVGDSLNGCSASCQRYGTNEIGDLMWMKCAQGKDYLADSDACSGPTTTFQYCDGNNNSCNGEVNGGLLDGNGSSEAWDACSSLVYAGYTDWRVPNKEELASLVKCNDGPLGYPGRTSCGSGNYTLPTIDTELFPDFPSRYFWTSASYVDNSNYAWYVGFHSVYTYGYLKDFRVRCVCALSAVVSSDPKFAPLLL